MPSTSTLNQLQVYIWNGLPVRKKAIDKEMLDDVIMTAIQVWPIDTLAQTEKQSKEELVALSDVCADIKRILSFVYGESRFNGYWRIGLDTLMPQTVSIMCEWWKTRKDNRAKLRLWRKKWRIDG
jgi:hypothetical protein